MIFELCESCRDGSASCKYGQNLLLVWPSLKIPAEFITDKEGREIPHCNGLGETLILKGYKSVKIHKVPQLFFMGNCFGGKFRLFCSKNLTFGWYKICRDMMIILVIIKHHYSKLFKK